MTLGFTGRELLQAKTSLAQTLGNTGHRQRRKLSKRANAPESQSLENLCRVFLLDAHQLVSQMRNRKLAEAGQLFTGSNKSDPSQPCRCLNRRVRVCCNSHTH